MVVPFAPGGPTDTIGRILAERLRASFGQPVIIENVTGAGGSIGVGRVARASPDGYTLSIGHWGTHVVNGAIYALQYDLLKDFEPISLIASNPWLIVAKNSMPANDLKGFITWLKANPDKASAGTGGVGSCRRFQQRVDHLSDVADRPWRRYPLRPHEAMADGKWHRASRCAATDPIAGSGRISDSDRRKEAG